MRTPPKEQSCFLLIFMILLLLVTLIIVIVCPIKNGDHYWKLGFRYSNSSSINATMSSSSLDAAGRVVDVVEDGLARARAAIKEAAGNGSMISSYQDPDYVPQGPIYWNANAFHRSYLEMEKEFKIYVYKEGEPPLFHNGECKSLYFSEGRFINEMEKEGMMNNYRTTNPEEAHVYFLPMSVVMMVKYLHVKGSHDIHPIGRTIADYVDTIRNKYAFWNHSNGADHFMLSCHDWVSHHWCIIYGYYKKIT